jgi:hypothetical protein
MKKIVFALGCLACFLQVAQAQNTTSAQANHQEIAQAEINWENFELELDEASTNWTFHTDQNRQVLYIDFQALGGNMSKLVVQNANKEIVMTDDQLFDLPANTIYEVDLAEFGKGNYTVELHTYNSIIREEINLQ